MHMVGRASRRHRWIGGTALLAIASSIMAATAIPALATVSELPDRTWQTDGPVYAIARAGGRIYLAGDFHHLVDRDGNSVQRTRLAALDATTGAPVASWAPSADDVVRGLAPSADGSRIFVAGDFRSVNGVGRHGLAAIRASDGRVVDAWSTPVNGTVHDVAVYGSAVYIAGSFSGVAGVDQPRLAALEAGTGRVDRRFDPRIEGSVRAVAIAPDGGVLYLVGGFDHVDGFFRNHVAAVNPSTGALRSWNPAPSYPALDVAAGRARVYVAGAGAGGTLGAFDAVPSDDRAWEVRTDGNLQAIGFIGTTVYAGGHFDHVGGATRRKIFAVRADDGGLLRWDPGLNSSVGVRAVLGYGDRLYVGGDFTHVGSSPREGFAEFTDHHR
jgi:trimeric autotransporter adhesin